MTVELQKDLILLAELTDQLRAVDAKLVAACDTEQAAYRLCRRVSPVHRTDESLAELMGVSKGQLNTLLNCDHNQRKRHMGRTLQNRLQRICQNTAIDQWGALELQGLLNCQRTLDDQEAALQAQLDAIRAKRAGE